MNGTRQDPFLRWLHGLYLGQPSDRQRWLAWVAMVSLMIKAKPKERHAWHRYFARLAVIEKDPSISESERGQAFMDLIEEAKPKLPTRGRPREDVSGLPSDLDTIVGLLAPAWPQGTAARKAALAGVERIAPLLKLEKVDRDEIISRRTPRAATLLILMHAHENEDTNAIEQTVKRARQGTASLERS